MRPARVDGFSLLEVLISIIVLCVGLLGMVGMQASSLQANRESRLQSSGVALARDLSEIIRSNPGAGATLSPTAVPLTVSPYSVDTSEPTLVAPSPAYCLSVGSYCSDTTSLANAQLTEWLARVHIELPGAHVVICFDGSPYDSTGIPEWPCDPSTAGGTLVVKIGWTRAAYSRGATTAGGQPPPADLATKPSVVLPLAVLWGM